MQSQDLFEIIKSRRSVMPTQYSKEEISHQELEIILESANWAPNHKRTEPWRFLVIEGESRQKFADFMLAKYLESTPEPAQNERKKNAVIEKCLLSDKIILICMKTSDQVPEWEEVAATAMAVQNMWLMCTSMKIGSYWSTPGAIQKMNEFTDLGDGVSCKGIFYMGNLSGTLHESTRNPIKEKIKYI